MEPVDLSGSDAPTARRFAWAQLDLVNQGMRPGEATKVLEEQFAEDAKKWVPWSQQSRLSDADCMWSACMVSACDCIVQPWGRGGRI